MLGISKRQRRKSRTSLPACTRDAHCCDLVTHSMRSCYRYRTVTATQHAPDTCQSQRCGHSHSSSGHLCVLHAECACMYLCVSVCVWQYLNQLHYHYCQLMISRGKKYGNGEQQHHHCCRCRRSRCRRCMHIEFQLSLAVWRKLNCQGSLVFFSSSSFC